MADKRKGRKVAPVKLSKGVILTDTFKVSWSIMEPIGAGGFGVIYSVKKQGSTESTTYAAKVEPHGNGPLFVEKNFFIRFLKPELIEDWKKKMKLSFLGLPKYMGSGTHVTNNVDHRFLIMERFGDPISSRLKGAGESIDLKLLTTFCSQIIDSLMYIHEKGYAHMDIKPENLLLKYNSKNDQVYLIDFGIIDKYTTDPVFKPDKKKQHNGTLLYCSRDSHSGVGTMRGDLEILGYNILAWCGYEFPWSKCLKTPAVVHQKKIDLMSDLDSLKNRVPTNIVNYLKYVNQLRHDETPDYERAKSVLRSVSTDSGTPKRRKRNATNDEVLFDSSNGDPIQSVDVKLPRTRSRNIPDENDITSKISKNIRGKGRSASSKMK
ncbi:nucleosomal histone kinase 1-like [Planococcus citri]|uniref:nucleosomal histone kinase 1-like n=1 Tax=Planococcus citri TaxID=170843 RepID=UPI0031F9E7F2